MKRRLELKLEKERQKEEAQRAKVKKLEEDIMKF